MCVAVRGLAPWEVVRDRGLVCSCFLVFPVCRLTKSELIRGLLHYGFPVLISNSRTFWAVIMLFWMMPVGASVINLGTGWELFWVEVPVLWVDMAD